VPNVSYRLTDVNVINLLDKVWFTTRAFLMLLEVMFL
jgi:hypothetical protein